MHNNQPSPGNRGEETYSRKIHLPAWIVYFPYIATGLLLVSIFIFFKGVLSIESSLREASAIKEAEDHIQAIESFRTLYTNQVVEPLRRQGLKVAHDYHDKAMTIALPATLSMELGEEIAKSTNQKLIFRLYSQYPFPWRTDGGGLDAFEKQALINLGMDKSKPFYRFEDKGGQRVLRYAKADVMRFSCVDCHNNHPQTPRSDWQVGDVRGALAVTLSMSELDNGHLHELHEARFGLIMFSFILLGALIVSGQIIKKYVIERQ